MSDRTAKMKAESRVAILLSAVYEQTRYEINTIKRAITIVDKALRESMDEENNEHTKRLGQLVGELLAFAELVENRGSQHAEELLKGAEDPEATTKPHSSVV